MAKATKKSEKTNEVTVTETPKEAKKVVKRTKFAPDADTKYEVAMPDGFDFAKHYPVQKRNFANEALYYDHRAAEMQFKKEQFEAHAEICRTQGSAADRRKAKQIVKLQSKVDELRAILEAQGINVEELLANSES